MGSKGITAQLINFLLYTALQVLVMRNIVLFDVSFCYVYVAALLLLPLNTPQMTSMSIAFALGLFVDMFYSTPGINAAACVLMMFLRPFALKMVSSSSQSGLLEGVNVLSVTTVGFRPFLIYASVLIFAHHTTLFFVEAARANLFFQTLQKVVASGLFTLGIVVISQYLFDTTPQRKR